MLRNVVQQASSSRGIRVYNHHLPVTIRDTFAASIAFGMMVQHFLVLI